MTNNQSIQKLHQLIVWGRWGVALLLWLTLAPVCLWHLRREIGLWWEHFTWAAVRYGLVHHRWSTMGLSVCIGLTAAILVWQSRNILMGFPPKYQRWLEHQVQQIQQQGPSHLLWKWVMIDKHDR